MTSPSTMDDISQPMSESFLHLSQDDTADLSTIQDDLTNTYNTNDLSMYIRMAKSLDGQIHNQHEFSSHSDLSEEEPLPHGSSQDQHNNKPAFTTNSNLDKFREVYDDSKSVAGTTFFPSKSGSFAPHDHYKAYQNSSNAKTFQNTNDSKTYQNSNNNVKAYQNFNNADNSRMFSSHSTPFASKSNPFSSIKSKNYNKRSGLLPEINESRNEDTMIDRKHLGPAYPKGFQHLVDDASDEEANDESTLDQHNVLAHSSQTQLNTENDVAWRDQLDSPSSNPSSKSYGSDENKENVERARTPLKPQLPSSQIQSVQFSAEDLYKSIQPYLVANMKEFKDVIEDMCIQNLKQQQQQQQQQQKPRDDIGQPPSSDMYKTPAKTQSDVESNEDEAPANASSDDEDNLSLHGTDVHRNRNGTSPLRRETTDYREATADNGEGISSVEVSPVTTPPRSRENGNEDDKSAEHNQWYRNNTATSDISYVPKRARQKKGTSSVKIQNAKVARSQQHYFNDESNDRNGDAYRKPRSRNENHSRDTNIDKTHENFHDERLRHLQSQIDALQQTTEHLKQDKYLLQRKVNTLTTQLEHYEEENYQINMEDDLTTDQINVNFLEPDMKESAKTKVQKERPARVEKPNPTIQLQRQVEDLKRTNRSLQAQLTTVRTDNDELSNENKYLRHQLKRAEQAADDSTKQYDYDISKLSLEVERLRLQVGNDNNNVSEEVITEESVDTKFRSYYNKLQLYKIDQLSKHESNNIIKNIMLSLLVTNFDNLPMATVKVGKYLQLSTKFIDQLHGHLYTDHQKPSNYLRNHGFNEELQELEMCLAGMMKKIIKE